LACDETDGEAEDEAHGRLRMQRCRIRYWRISQPTQAKHKDDSDTYWYAFRDKATQRVRPAGEGCQEKASWRSSCESPSEGAVSAMETRSGQGNYIRVNIDGSTSGRKLRAYVCVCGYGTDRRIAGCQTSRTHSLRNAKDAGSEGVVDFANSEDMQQWEASRKQ